MSHYFTYSPLTPNSVARASDVNVRFQGVVAAFELLPEAELIAQDRVTYGADIGVANAMVINPVVPVLSYEEGLRVRAKAFARNTMATTVNISGLGVKQIVRSDGTALQAGDIVAGQIVDLTYDGTEFRLAMAFAELSPAGVATKLAAAGAVSLSGNLSVTGGITSTGTVAVSSDATNSAAVNLGRTAGGALLNTPSATTGYLSVANSPIAAWSSTGLSVTGTLTSSGKLTVSSGGSEHTGDMLLKGNIASDGARGSTITLYDNSATAYNRIILGADSAGAYVQGTHSSGVGDVNIKVVGTTIGKFSSTGLTVTGQTEASDEIFGRAWGRFTGWRGGASSDKNGPGVEVGYTSGASYIHGYDRTGGTYTNMNIVGSPFIYQRIGGTAITTVSSTGLSVTGAVTASSGLYGNALYVNGNLRLGGAASDATNIYGANGTTTIRNADGSATYGTFSSTGLSVTGNVTTSGTEQAAKVHVGGAAANATPVLNVKYTSTSSTTTGTTAYGGMHFENTATTADYYHGITFSGVSTGTQAGILCQSGPSYGTRLRFFTSNAFASGQSLRMTLDENGNLSNTGTISVSGTNNTVGPLTTNATTLAFSGGSLQLAGRNALFLNSSQTNYYAPNAGHHYFCNSTGSAIWASIKESILSVTGTTISTTTGNTQNFTAENASGNVRLHAYHSTYGGSALLTFNGSYASYAPMSHDAAEHKFYAYSTHVATINNLGVTTPIGGAKLFVAYDGDATRQNQIQIGADGSGSFVHGTFSTGGTGNVRILCANVLAGTFTTTGFAPTSSTTASAANVYQASSGSELLRSTSSLRYKQDVLDITDAEADKVLELRPVTYRSKAEADDQTKRHWGFIAEEADDAGLEALIHFDADGAPDGFQYERVVVGLLNIIKRQEARIAALEAATGG